MQDGKKPPRAEQPIRAASVPRTPSIDPLKPPGKYTFQTNQLPRPQYPSVKNIDSKTAKQVSYIFNNYLLRTYYSVYFHAMPRLAKTISSF